MTGKIFIERSTRVSRLSFLAGLILFALLVIAPFWTGRSEIHLLIEIFSYLALASLWNLLAGYTGLVSVGQQAFVGLGGYSLFAVTMFASVQPLLAIPLAGLIAAFCAIPTALVIFRLKGAYFAIGTWVVAEVYRLVLAQIGLLGGGSGSSLPAYIVQGIAENRTARDMALYWTALGLVFAIMAGIYLILRSRLGIALTAIRDNELAAESLGVDQYRTKLLIYLLTAAATGSVGALIFLQKLRITPEAAFSVNDWTVFVIFIVVIGGIGRIEGPLAGTLVFFVLRELFADWGRWYLMLLGGFAVIVMLLAPQGLWGFFADRFDLHVFPLRRRVRLPDRKPGIGSRNNV